MKHFCLILGMLFCLGTVSAQMKVDTIPPYKKSLHIPAFRILQTDSTTWFTKEELPKSDYTIVVYFSPDCGHCQYEAKEFVKNMDSLKNTFMVWVSYKSISEIREFYHYYGLDQFSNLRMGRDPMYAVPSFYQVKFTPFIAVYNKRGMFVKAYESGVEMAELNALLKQQ